MGQCITRSKASKVRPPRQPCTPKTIDGHRDRSETDEILPNTETIVPEPGTLPNTETIVPEPGTLPDEEIVLPPDLVQICKLTGPPPEKKPVKAPPRKSELNREAMNQSLFRAAMTGNTKKIRTLIRLGVDPSWNDNIAIRYAVAYGNLEAVRLLLTDARIDPGVNNNEPIRLAFDTKLKEIVALLLADPRVDPKVDDNYLIRKAIHDDDLEMVQLLATIPGVVSGAIDFYLQYDNFDNLNRLAQMTYALSTQRGDMLVWAAAHGSLNLVHFLLRDGVSASYANNSAVAAAERYNQTKVKTYLLAVAGVTL